MRYLLFTILFTLTTQLLTAQNNKIVDQVGSVKNAAQFPGGMDSLHRYINTSLTYPPYIKTSGKEINEVIHVEFTVNHTGEIDNVNIHSGKNRSLKRQAVKLVENMPNWKPAEMEGKLVEETIILPIHFYLASNN